MTVTADSLKQLKLNQIASVVALDWVKVSPYAMPYLDAMYNLYEITDSYGADSASGVVSYFLANAGSWKGDTAKLVKAELKRRTAAYFKSQGF